MSRSTSGFDGPYGTTDIRWWNDNPRGPYSVVIKASALYENVFAVYDNRLDTVVDAWVPTAKKDKAIEWLLDYASTRLGVELKLEG